MSPHPTERLHKTPDYQGFRVKRMKGFEPSTFAMARRRSSQLSYIRKGAYSTLNALARVAVRATARGSASASPSP
jgi:hypothetical protein